MRDVDSLRALSRLALSAREPVRVEDDARVPAAVLLLLYAHGGREHVLFQVRTHLVLHHKGEIGLPGGRRDPEDVSLEATALRETHEEIGVDPAHVQVLGQLDDVATLSSNYAITPFVGAIIRPGAYPFRTARREVSELLQVPLDHLRAEDATEWVVREVEGERTAERSFHYGQHLIWGATARAVGQYLDLLAEAERGQPRHEAARP